MKAVLLMHTCHLPFADTFWTLKNVLELLLLFVNIVNVAHLVTAIDMYTRNQIFSLNTQLLPGAISVFGVGLGFAMVAPVSV